MTRRTFSRRTFCKLFAAAAAAIALPPLELLAAGAGDGINGTYLLHKGQNIGGSDLIWTCQREFDVQFHSTVVEKINSETWLPPLDPGWRCESIDVRPIKGSRAAFTVTYRLQR